MSTREIQGHLEEIYGVEVSPTLISNVTEAVLEEVKAWQGRPLEELYPILYLDALMVKIRDNGHIQNKAIYVAIGVNIEGNKEVLGLWASQNEGAKFWLQVLTELQSRGVKDILIACVDGLKGFPEAIEAVYPKAEVQLCIVHLVRASLNYVSWKQRKRLVDIRACKPKLRPCPDNFLFALMYFGKLSRQQRRLKVEPDAPVAVLDELLLLFLLRESGDKLPAFLRCSLPFTSVNPYIDFGNIPPEMFYGRTEMVDELQRRRGSCLVYGGRQLGKSVLLREVCRRFDDASKDQYAWVQDAPKKGKPTSQIWRDLLARHQGKKLLSDKLSTGKPEEIHKYILEMLSNAGDRQVLVLLDEADDFLEADADDSFAQVKSLRELMVRTDSRFRIVFAGIHHVQKFQGIPNQPPAQFGSPICVGPLEPGPASDLVVEPLDAIGIRFSDNSLPLLVLSYTNYHTGLIQSFCRELLRHVFSRRPAAGPPYEIGRSDIEAVYHRGAKLPDLLRERFDLTIRVDERYRAITWAMVEKQLKQRDSYSLSFSREEVGSMAAYWWPQVFKYTSEEELRGLLIEMVGLGILSRTNEGRYRLRSPNLIPILGSEADITDSLLNLESKPAPSAFNADSYHIILSDNENAFSPLSFAHAELDEL